MMVTISPVLYMRLEQLLEHKNITRKGVTTPRKQPRFDLVACAGYWEPLERLKNYRGEIFFNLIPSDKNEYRKQGGTTPEYYLQVTPAKSGSINFSGVRFLYEEGKEKLFASGEPSKQAKLKGGVINPMYARREDGFLFIFSKDMQTLEVIVLEGGGTLIDAYRKQLSCGGLDDILVSMRKQAKSNTEQ